jgi:hypothetical protein
MRVVVAVLAEMSDLMLGAGGQWRGGTVDLPNKGGDTWVLLTPRWCSG